MKPFSSFAMVRHSVDTVWGTMRDRLPEIGRRIDDLRSIDELERANLTDRNLRIVNRWVAKQDLPLVLQIALATDSISWIDRAVWDESARVCTWTLEPSMRVRFLECAGTTRYAPAMAGRGTRVSFEGQFELNTRLLGNLPGGFEQTLSRFAESVIATVIPRSLSRAVTAAGELIATERRSRA